MVSTRAVLNQHSTKLGYLKGPNQYKIFGQVMSTATYSWREKLKLTPSEINRSTNWAKLKSSVYILYTGCFIQGVSGFNVQT